MTGLVELLASMEPDRFQRIVAASPKKFREELFRRTGFKKKSSAFTLKAAGNDADRALRLQQGLRDGASPGREYVEELVRNYLYGRRDMLADALDFLGVQHDGGLTDTDLDFLGLLPVERGQALRSLLVAKYDPNDVSLYLSFMSIPGTVEGTS